MSVPDFRSPKTGLYANLARLNLPTAESVFDIDYFRTNPRPFYLLAKELYPGNYHPTLCHVFIALLAKKGLLAQLYTQNIDCLERQAGVPGHLVVEAHGSFATQRCIECKTSFPGDAMRQHVFNNEVPRCVAEDCNGLVKPDIVFFGESLPSAFFRSLSVLETADLALVIGTSLTVQPFANLPDQVHDDCPRVLFNLEQAGTLGTWPDDVLWLGDCNAGISTLADHLGWLDELNEMWRDIVGDDEADKQLADVMERKKQMMQDIDELSKRLANSSLEDNNRNGESNGGKRSSDETLPTSGAAQAEEPSEEHSESTSSRPVAANLDEGNRGIYDMANGTEVTTQPNTNEKPQSRDVVPAAGCIINPGTREQNGAPEDKKELEASSGCVSSLDVQPDTSVEPKKEAEPKIAPTSEDAIKKPHDSPDKPPH